MTFRFLILILLISLIGCKTDDRKSFLFSIEYSSPWGFPVKYKLSQNKLTVDGVPNKNSKETAIVYERILSKEQSDSIYKFLKSSSYDTLKSKYENPNFYDGTDIIFKISGEELNSKTVAVYMKSTLITDALEKEMERQIYIKKYLWRHYLDE